MYTMQTTLLFVLLSSVFMLSLFRIERIKESEHLQNYAREISKLLRPLTLFIVLSATIAYFAPKFGPQWPNPMDFYNSTHPKQVKTRSF